MKRHNDMSTSILATSLCGLLLAGWCVQPGVAEAGDGKVFAAHICQGETEEDRDNLTYLGSYVHAEQDDTHITCPLVRDIIAGELDDIWVRIFHGGSGNDIECTVYSVSTWGGFVDTVTISHTGSGPASMHFNLADFTEYDNGSYAITCTLSAQDRVYSLRSYEE